MLCLKPNQTWSKLILMNFLLSWARCCIAKFKMWNLSFICTKKLTYSRTMISFLHPSESYKSPVFLTFSGGNKGNMERSWLGAQFRKTEKILTQGSPHLNSIELSFDLAILFLMTWRVASSISLGISLSSVRLNISVKDLFGWSTGFLQHLLLCWIYNS